MPMRTLDSGLIRRADREEHKSMNELNGVQVLCGRRTFWVG